MAVAFDAVGPDATGADVNSSATLSWNHTCSGSNRLLVVSVSMGNSPDTSITTSVTYNGVSMTSLTAPVHGNSGTAGYVQLFYLVAPATGTNTVAVTVSTSVDAITGGSVSFTGVNQSTPLNGTTTNTGTGTSASVSVTTNTNDMIVDGICCGNGFNTGSTQTNRWLRFNDSNTSAGSGAQSTATGSGSVTMGYSINTDDWGIIGTNVSAAPQAPTVTTDSITNINGTTATGNGTVVSDGGATITERGVCWSTSANPTTSDSKATASGTTGSYSASITGLSNNTTYHVRAYATNANGTTYGSDLTFLVYYAALSWIGV